MSIAYCMVFSWPCGPCSDGQNPCSHRDDERHDRISTRPLKKNLAALVEQKTLDGVVVRQADRAIVRLRRFATMPRFLREVTADGPIGLILLDPWRIDRVQ